MQPLGVSGSIVVLVPGRRVGLQRPTGGDVRPPRPHRPKIIVGRVIFLNEDDDMLNGRRHGPENARVFIDRQHLRRQHHTTSNTYQMDSHWRPSNSKSVPRSAPPWPIRKSVPIDGKNAPFMPVIRGVESTGGPNVYPCLCRQSMATSTRTIMHIN